MMRRTRLGERVLTEERFSFRLVRRGARDHSFPPPPAYDGKATFGLPFSWGGISYYSTLASPDYRDVSFAVADPSGPVAIIQADIDGGRQIARFGSPIEIWFSDRISPASQRKIIREVSGELRRLAMESGCSILIRTSSKLDPGGLLAARLADMRASAVPCIRAVLDLSFSDDALLKAMHKGHRQDIRWGGEHLTISTVDRANPNEELFHAYRELHAQVSGRVTRPIESWNAMFALIAQGGGDLLLAYLDGELVGGTLILDDSSTAYYASGANRRDRFDKGISHYPLFLACARARARGRSSFDVGETLGGTIDANDPKQVAIGRFKGGFKDSADVSIVWTVPAKGG